MIQHEMSSQFHLVALMKSIRKAGNAYQEAKYTNYIHVFSFANVYYLFLFVHLFLLLLIGPARRETGIETKKRIKQKSPIQPAARGSVTFRILVTAIIQNAVALLGVNFMDSILRKDRKNAQTPPIQTNADTSSIPMKVMTFAMNCSPIPDSFYFAYKLSVSLFLFPGRVIIITTNVKENQLNVMCLSDDPLRFGDIQFSCVLRLFFQYYSFRCQE